MAQALTLEGFSERRLLTVIDELYSGKLRKVKTDRTDAAFRTVSRRRAAGSRRNKRLLFVGT